MEDGRVDRRLWTRRQWGKQLVPTLFIVQYFSAAGVSPSHPSSKPTVKGGFEESGV